MGLHQILYPKSILMSNNFLPTLEQIRKEMTARLNLYF